jgi:Spy/CpxP family protein refolding chaperone
MRNVLLSRKIQLVVVMLLSGLFLTGCKGHNEGHGGMMFDVAAYKLDLTEAQEETWFAIRDELKQLRKEARKEKHNHLDQAKSLIMADSLDQAAVLNQFEQHQGRMLSAAPSVIEKLSAFHATLTVEQKDKVLKMLDHFAKKKKG